MSFRRVAALCTTGLAASLFWPRRVFTSVSAEPSDRADEPVPSKRMSEFEYETRLAHERTKFEKALDDERERFKETIAELEANAKTASLVSVLHPWH